jgi:hypothetical protein
MADEEGGEKQKKADLRYDYIRDRISSAFPKLAGPKLDKLLGSDEARYGELCNFES